MKKKIKLNNIKNKNIIVNDNFIIIKNIIFKL